MSCLAPPFTSDQVSSLNAYQEHCEVEPVLCTEDPLHGDLVATEEGWSCLCCDYRQPWAYSWQADWSWNNLSDKEAGWWYAEMLVQQ